MYRRQVGSGRFISCHGWLTSVDDILHARIQTMGVTEHIFDVDIHGKSVSWHLFDVGGARGQRHSWVPYFDDANAIIFVSPISAFDQVCLFTLTSTCLASFLA